MKRNKPYLLSFILLLCLSMACFAEATQAKKQFKGTYKDAPCPPVLTLKDGLYFGAAAGYDSYRIADELDVAINPRGLSLDPRLDVSGAVGGAFIGLGHYFQSFYNTYFALELFGNGSAAKSDYELFFLPSQFFETNIQVKSNYGIGLLPGIKLNNATLFYLRVGYNWTNIDVKERVVINGVRVAYSKEAVTSSGLNYGLGVEAAFYQNWSIRTEYTHTDYSGFDTSIETDIAPADNQFMLGLIYHFD